MKIHGFKSHRPNLSDTRKTARDMHELADCYTQLGIFWVNRGGLPLHLIRAAYEAAGYLHALAAAIDDWEDYQDRKTQALASIPPANDAGTLSAGSKNTLTQNETAKP